MMITMGLNTIPVLQQDFIKHLSQLNLPNGSNVCVGKMSGRLDMEEAIRRLPVSMKYHGLGKGKYINKKTFESIDTSLWISAALAKKFDVWTGNSSMQIKINVNNMNDPIRLRDIGRIVNESVSVQSFRDRLRQITRMINESVSVSITFSKGFKRSFSESVSLP